uniref:Uncharacterized protein n=1 Tax=Rhizophora mucronata TaxID=61149 RepID=A0A2P2PSM5_RHIMU
MCHQLGASTETSSGHLCECTNKQRMIIHLL